MKKITGSNTFLLPIVFVGALISGCASVTGTKVQSLAVQTNHENIEISGADCTLTNDEGKWFVTTPANVTVHKSTADLVIDCAKDGVGAGRETVVSKANGAVWGNILFGAGIGYVVDRNTGAGFNYQQSITVVLRKTEQALK